MDNLNRSHEHFDPQKSNFESLTNAKSKCSNPFWKEVFSLLIECRLNVLLNHPAEYRHIPVNGELLIIYNYIPARQEWAQNKCLDSIIDNKGNLKSINEVNCSRKPFEYEYNELKRFLVTS